MVDAEPIASGAEPGIFASFRIAVPPEVTELDLLDGIQIMRRQVGRPRLIEICSASIEVADSQHTFGTLLGESGEQRFPVRDFRAEVRHVDADQTQHGKIDTDHTVRLGQSRVDRPMFAEGVPGSDKHTVPTRRWYQRRCVSITECPQGGTKPLCRLASAIFGKNRDISVMTL